MTKFQLEKSDFPPVEKRVNIFQRQMPLRKQFGESPQDAMIVDHAVTSSDTIVAKNPLYGSVTCGTGLPVEVPIGVHWAVGGKSDFPVPGEMFSASIASCLDSSIRMIANILGIGIERLSVSVEAHVDVRGTLQMNSNVPVGFQEIRVNVDIEGSNGVTEQHLNKLLKLAEHSCVMLQTLRNPPQVSVSRTQSASDSNPVLEVDAVA